MQTHHLLATLRVEKPKTKQQLLSILKDHKFANYSKEQVDQAWQHCQLKEYKEVVEVMQQQRVRSISLNSHKIQNKLQPLVYIFDKMDLIREQHGLQDDKGLKKMSEEKEVNQQLSALRFEAERKLKDFINESCLDRSFTQVLQESIVRFQEERNRLNEKQGKEGTEKAKKRLQDRQMMKSAKLQQQISFALQNDDNKVRAQSICAKLISDTQPHFKPSLTDKQEQRVNKILNTKFIY